MYKPMPQADGVFLFLYIDRLRGKPARTATQGERTPAPLENPQAQCPSRQAAGKSSHYLKNQRKFIEKNEI